MQIFVWYQFKPPLSTFNLRPSLFPCQLGMERNIWDNFENIITKNCFDLPRISRSEIEMNWFALLFQAEFSLVNKWFLFICSTIFFKFFLNITVAHECAIRIQLNRSAAVQATSAPLHFLRDPKFGSWTWFIFHVIHIIPIVVILHRWNFLGDLFCNVFQIWNILQLVEVWNWRAFLWRVIVIFIHLVIKSKMMLNINFISWRRRRGLSLVSVMSLCILLLLFLGLLKHLQMIG